MVDPNCAGMLFTQHLLADVHRLAMQRLGLVRPASLIQVAGQVLVTLCRQRMHLTQDFTTDLQRFAVQRLGLAVFGEFGQGTGKIGVTLGRVRMPFPQDHLADLQDAAEHPLGFGVIPRGEKASSQIVLCPHRVRMLSPKDVTPGRQDPPQERLSFKQLVQVEQECSLIVQRLERIGMFISEHAAAGFEDRLQQRIGLGISGLGEECHSQVVLHAQRERFCVPSSSVANLQGTTEMDLGLLIRTQFAIEVAERLADRRFDFRLSGEGRVDLRRGAVEDLRNGELAPIASILRCRLRQQVINEEPVDRLGCFAFEVGLLVPGFRLGAAAVRLRAMVLGAEVAEERSGKPGREDDQQCGDEARDDLVASGPTPGRFEGADGAGRDRRTDQVPPDVHGEFPGAGVAALWFLRHRLQADRLQITWDVVVDASRGPGLVVQDLVQEHSRVAPKWELAGQEPVEDDAEGVNVAPAVDLVGLAAGLFGAHVGRSAQHLAVLGHGDLTGLALGQAKVQQMWLSQRIEKDVRGFDVTVHDAAVVGVLKGIGQNGDELGGLAGWERAGGQDVRQARAFDKLADQIRHPIRQPDLVDRDDRRMMQLRH